MLVKGNLSDEALHNFIPSFWEIYAEIVINHDLSGYMKKGEKGDSFLSSHHNPISIAIFLVEPN